MKRDSVVTSLLLVNACLLLYVAIQVWQRPSLYDIDARIEYWHHYYRDVDRSRIARTKDRDDTNSPTIAASAAADFVGGPSQAERADSAVDQSPAEPPSGAASRSPLDDN